MMEMNNDEYKNVPPHVACFPHIIAQNKGHLPIYEHLCERNELERQNFIIYLNKIILKTIQVTCHDYLHETLITV